jgi:hypothetical protein
MKPAYLEFAPATSVLPSNGNQLEQTAEAVPYLSMLSAFADSMGRQDLSPEDRMDEWVALMRSLRDN